jgi:hypothetical protein
MNEQSAAAAAQNCSASTVIPFSEKSSVLQTYEQSAIFSLSVALHFFSYFMQTA